VVVLYSPSKVRLAGKFHLFLAENFTFPEDGEDGEDAIYLLWFCARRTFWLDPLSFLTSSRNVRRSFAVNRTIYFLLMGHLLVAGSLPNQPLSNNPNFWL